MTEYILKRLLWFIPTLVLVTLLGFLLLVSSPGDPLDQLVPALSAKNPQEHEAERSYWSKQLGLDLPVFYFSVTTWAEPDTLYKLQDPEKRKAYRALLHLSGNAEALNRYYAGIERSRGLMKDWLQRGIADSTLSTGRLRAMEAPWNSIEGAFDKLETNGDTLQIRLCIRSIRNAQSLIAQGIPDLAAPVEAGFGTLFTEKTRYKNYIPKITWYGTHNRYHQWLFGNGLHKGVIRGDFGISYIHKQPVMTVISDKMIWSLVFSLLSIILAYFISIPIGMRLADKPHARTNRLIQAGLFLLYSTPVFFGGVLLLMLFANPDVLSLFPPSGIKPIGGYSDDAGFFEKLADSLPYMVLPLICYTYSSLAYISRLTQTSLLEQLPLDYIKTARAKGLSEKALIRRHALRNSLLPLITVFSAIFPSIIGGSVIIESIFTIPGMGLETVKAIIAKDYPIVIAVITLSCILTMLSYLLADILYAWADPRIRYKT